MKKQENLKPQSHIRVHLRSGGFVSVNLHCARPKVGSSMERSVDANGWLVLPKRWRDYHIPKDNISYIEVLDTTGFSEDDDD